MTEAPSLTILVVTYNSAAVVGDCLRSIDAHAGTGVEVVVVDNASSDDTAGVVGDALAAATFLAQADNRGYSAAINAGIAAMPRRDAVLVLNPDVRLEGARSM
jgi:GT2 family glycosyltransferase